MGLLRWLRTLLFSRDVPTAPFTDWTGYGYLGVVGESQYQAVLRDVARRTAVCEATLIPEPDNPFDANAVVVKIEGEVVGYLPCSHARRYQRRLLLLPEPMRCPAKLIGGTSDKPFIGVLIDQRTVERLPAPKRTRKKRTVDPTDTPF